ncbi:MAG: SpoIIE family protein phosphatase, partial [Bacilli bacterium]|nr:SpoIIE family protein phosphatase [Bacilli bacterium]
MSQEEQNRYVEEYYKNEYDANLKITWALTFTAALLTIIWILYLIPGIFSLTEITRIVTCIALPVFILVLLSPQLFIRREQGKKRGFKYFLLVSFFLVMLLLNILIPKHAIMGWAVCIILTNHYYNPKVGRIIFIITLIGLFIGIYLAMFLGEFDSNLMMGELDEETGLIRSFRITETFLDTPAGRYEYLRCLQAAGKNRMITAAEFYFFPRAIVVTILFYSSNQLNKRTYKLLVNEIKVNSEQEKINTELEVAKDIQLATLPSEIVASQDVEIVGELKAAKEVGGDFYDYFRIDNEHIAILIGDVSGKGIPAAMFMMKTITCFKNFTRIDKTPGQILKEVNASIYEGNHSQMFVTCFLAILNKKTGLLQFANAGHNPPIIGNNRHFRYLKCNSGFILGGMKEAFVKDEQITLK